MSPVLVIAFKFPPFAGVGGFRWAKMVKYLARLGREVHVVTVDWDASGPGILPEKYYSPLVHVHRIASGFPHKQLHYRGNDPSCIALREEVRTRMMASGFFDEAGAWGETLIPACRELIARHGIRLAIATGHPFHANEWAADLKAQTPGLKLIQDFRDLISSLMVNTAATQDDCQAMQRRCVEQADAVVAISAGMVRILQQETPSDTYHVIRNGFDPEVLEAFHTLPEDRSPTAPLSFCYLGSLGFGRHLVMETFLHAVEVLAARGRRIKVTMCGDNHGYIAKAFPSLIDTRILHLHPSLPLDQAMRLAVECDFGLNLLSPPMGHYLPTKIYDYMGAELPCLSIGPEGDTSELLRKHDCGVALPQDLAVIARAMDTWCDTFPRFSFKDVDQLGADRLAAEYNALINRIVGESHG